MKILPRRFGTRYQIAADRRSGRHRRPGMVQPVVQVARSSPGRAERRFAGLGIQAVGDARNRATRRRVPLIDDPELRGRSCPESESWTLPWPSAVPDVYIDVVLPSLAHRLLPDRCSSCRILCRLRRCVSGHRKSVRSMLPAASIDRCCRVLVGHDIDDRVPEAAIEVRDLIPVASHVDCGSRLSLPTKSRVIPSY